MVYTVPAAATTHVITELPANTGYTVTAVVSGSNYKVSVVPGGTTKTTSAKGVLNFDMAADGTIN